METLNTSKKPTTNKIALNLDGGTEVLVEGFIAPIEYTQYNYHVEWNALATLRVAEPEKRYSVSVFQSFLHQNQFLLATSGVLVKRVCWNCSSNFISIQVLICT